MERNLDRRVEVLVSVRDRDLLMHLREFVLQAYLDDSDRARLLDSSGHYRRCDRPSTRPSAQDTLIAHYTSRDTESP